MNNKIDIPPACEIYSEWPWVQAARPCCYDPAVPWPKISIVTPSYNQGQYIEETIRSILLQNYPNLEYIIIDGGSTDETIEIIKKYEPWITYWVSERDRGQSHAINKGVEKCTGEIFNWLNSDDYYFPDTFYNVARSFLDNPEATTVSGWENHLQIDGTTTVVEGTFITESLLKTIEFVEMAQPSTFFRLECFKNIGPVAENLHYIMDGEFWVRYLLLYGQGSFCKIEKPLVNFRMHTGSKTVQSSVIYHFLFERSSILIDLQKFVGLPETVTEYWRKVIFNTPTVYELKREWRINETCITKRAVRIYFIKKYTLIQFRNSNKAAALWGTRQLVKNNCFDLFVIRSLVKLVFKRGKIKNPG